MSMLPRFALMGTLLLTAVPGWAQPTPTPTASPDVKHYVCYEIRRVRIPPLSASLEDRYGPSTADLKSPKRLCNPVDKNGEDPDAPSFDDHLLAFKIRQTDPKPALKINDQQVVNQFGSQGMRLRAPDFLLVPSAKSLVGPPVQGQPIVDHFKCYRVTRAARERVAGIQLTDQFGDLTVDTKKPRRLCTAVSKNGEPVRDPNANLMCYRVKQNPRRPQFVFTNPNETSRCGCGESFSA